MDIPEGSFSAKKITAENLNIELGEPQVRSPGLLGGATDRTPKLNIYNKATLPQKIQYWLVIGLSLGSLISYAASITSSLGSAFTTSNSTCISK